MTDLSEFGLALLITIGIFAVAIIVSFFVNEFIDWILNRRIEQKKRRLKRENLKTCIKNENQALLFPLTQVLYTNKGIYVDGDFFTHEEFHSLFTESIYDNPEKLKRWKRLQREVYDFFDVGCVK